MTEAETDRDLLDAVTVGGVTPGDCPRCGQDSWRPGQDDGRDADYVGYQCSGCGQVVGLDRADVEAAVAAALDGYRQGRERIHGAIRAAALLGHSRYSISLRSGLSRTGVTNIIERAAPAAQNGE